MSFASQDIKTLIEQCARGDPEAWMAFQATYGLLIYNFPMRIFHLSEEEGGDFYLYVFDKGRIFKRIRSFEGRNQIQFETYLSYYVLRDLFFEWTRTTDELETIALDIPLGDADADGDRVRTLQDVLVTEEPMPDAGLMAADEAREMEHILAQLDEDKRLALRLLALGSMEIASEDVQTLARVASRSVEKTLELLDEVVARLSTRTDKVQDKRDTLYTVDYWIQTYQRRMAVLDERIQSSRAYEECHTLERLHKDKAELERKLAWRYRQQQRLREDLQKAEVRPLYKDIAHLLNVPLGTICSRIARAREEFAQRFAAVRGTHA